MWSQMHLWLTATSSRLLWWSLTDRPLSCCCSCPTPWLLRSREGMNQSWSSSSSISWKQRSKNSCSNSSSSTWRNDAGEKERSLTLKAEKLKGTRTRLTEEDWNYFAWEASFSVILRHYNTSHPAKRKTCGQNTDSWKEHWKFKKMDLDFKKINNLTIHIQPHISSK